VVSQNRPLVAQNSGTAQVPSLKDQSKTAPPAGKQPIDPGQVVKRQSARPVLPPQAEPIEILSESYDDKRKLLDVTFRNTTDHTVLISQFVVKWSLVTETNKIEVSGSHDLGPLAEAARKARNKRQPLSFHVGFNVAYKVDAHYIDRHMFIFDVTPRDLYLPQKGSHYVMALYVKADRYKIVRDRRSVRIDGDKMYFEPAR
jgi:hypothetical protein